MATYRTSRIIPVILVVVIIIIAIAALVSLARVVFFSGSSTTTTTQVDVSREALVNTSASHSVSMTVRGPIVADEAFHSYTIEISPNSRKITTYSGYLETVVDQKVLSNNIAAYEEFVYALDKADLAKGKQLTEAANDTRGICATGNIYDFAIIDADATVKNVWTSTCKGSKGSLDASVTQLNGLFVKQIPDAEKMISAIRL